MPAGFTQIVPQDEAAWHASLRGSAAATPGGIVANAGRVNSESALLYGGGSGQQQFNNHQSSLIPGGQYASPVSSSSYQHQAHIPTVESPWGKQQQNSSSLTLASDGPQTQQGFGGGVIADDDSPRFGRDEKEPATDKDLQDAIESLQAARLRHRTLVKDLYGGSALGPSEEEVKRNSKRQQLESFYQSKHGAAAASSRGEPPMSNRSKRALADTLTARGQLSSEMTYLKSQMRETQSAAQSNSKMMRTQMGHISKEIHHVEEEVDQLEIVVKTMSQTCAVADDKVKDLQRHLQELTTEKESLTMKLQHFMANTRSGIQNVQRDMSSMDSEIARLTQENEFLKAQAARRL